MLSSRVLKGVSQTIGNHTVTRSLCANMSSGASSSRLKLQIVDGYTTQARKDLVEANVVLAGDQFIQMIQSVNSANKSLSMYKWYPFDTCSADTKLDNSWVGSNTSNGKSLAMTSTSAYEGSLYKEKGLHTWVHSMVNVGVLTCGPEDVIKGLHGFDGIVWTGCSSTVNAETVDVQAQLQLCQQAYTLGIPQYGSCWALQMAVKAAGGTVHKNPKGREMGVARGQILTEEARNHPFTKHIPPVFDVFESHEDEVSSFPENNSHTKCTLLASNEHSLVQAAAVQHKRGQFWAHQFHPEYSLKDMALLIQARAKKQTDLGLFESTDKCHLYAADMIKLHETDYKPLRIAMGIKTEQFTQQARYQFCKNWLHYVQKLKGSTQTKN